MSPFILPWWAETNWWEQPQYAGILNRDRREISAAFEHLRKLFDREWWDEVQRGEDGKANLVAGWLVGQGSWPYEYLFNFGEALLVFADTPGIQAKVRDLRAGERVLGTLFELQVAKALHDASIAVLFPLAGEQKGPDILATTARGTMAVECKKLEMQDVDRWMSRLMSIVAPRGYEAEQFGYDITLEPDLTFLRSDRPPEWNDAIMRALAQEIDAQVSAALREVPRPEFVNVAGIAKVRILAGEPGRGAVSGSPIYAAPTVRRLIEHLLRASHQIPVDTPGVVVMQCDVLPSESLIRAALAATVRTSSGKDPIDRVRLLVLSPALRWGAQKARAVSLGTMSEPLAQSEICAALIGGGI